MSSCPRCGETGVHASVEDCLKTLRRLVDGERMNAVTFQRTPNDSDLLTFTALLLDFFDPHERRRRWAKHGPDRPWKFRQAG